MSTTTITASSTSPTLRRVIVKQVLSGDSLMTRGQPRGGPPPENQVILSYIIAPKLARRPGGANTEETRDEPWAWEAREFLRRKLVGCEQDIYVAIEKVPNSTRDYGTIYIGNDLNNLENVTESIVSEGLVNVRRENIKYTPELQRLIELEDAAKSAQRGKWSTSSPSSEHIRNVKWQPERSVFDLNKGQPVKAIIEHVRDGSTLRAFLLPDFNYITLMISGIRCPGFKFESEGKSDAPSTVPFADEAKFFVESRLLQREVEIVLESVNNNNFVGSIIFHKGNIAEALLREGLAKCVDWSMAHMVTGADKLRVMEKHAKEKRVRLWQDYQSNAQTFSASDKDLTGTVTEILNGDCLNVKIAGTGNLKKIFLSSVRPPRKVGRVEEEEKEKPQVPQPPPPQRTAKNVRPLYDVPWMFECREFLRKKLIGKKVKCVLDYVSPARDSFPEKFCYTVLIGDKNVAEALIAKGLATVIRYRQDDDQRSSHYDDLLAAEQQANKGAKGLHAKKDVPAHHVNDLTVEHSRIKQQYLPSWQRALRTEAIVEFVASGSRFRVFISKDSCLVTFLLGGITCPRSSRPAMNNAPAQEGEPFGDEALAFVRERILQRDVSLHIETCDKAGTSVIGYLWTENDVNLSVALVEEGLATIHFTAEKSEYYKQLKLAEDSAKTQKKKIWLKYVEAEPEEKKSEETDDIVRERIVKPEEIVITEVTDELHFYAQYTKDGAKLVNLMSKLRKEFEQSPPIAGSFTPKRGEMCAAKFSEDNEWYRVKVERVQPNKKVSVIYVDYGNKEVTSVTELAALPSAFLFDQPYAIEFALALCRLPRDDDNKLEALKEFRADAMGRNLSLNVEYKITNIPYATLTDTGLNVDIGKALVKDGILLVDRRKEKRIAKLVAEYQEAEVQAQKSHLGIWEYGDITEDDAKEFGH